VQSEDEDENSSYENEELILANKEEET